MKILEPDIKELITLRAKGRPIRKIAKKLKRSATTISKENQDLSHIVSLKKIDKSKN